MVPIWLRSLVYDHGVHLVPWFPNKIHLFLDKCFAIYFAPISVFSYLGLVRNMGPQCHQRYRRNSPAIYVSSGPATGLLSHHLCTVPALLGLRSVVLVGTLHTFCFQGLSCGFDIVCAVLVLLVRIGIKRVHVVRKSVLDLMREPELPSSHHSHDQMPEGFCLHWMLAVLLSSVTVDFVEHYSGAFSKVVLFLGFMMESAALTTKST